ncbi:sensor histidine kinase [Haloechinothrix sp. LS1_15]|uniref:sensor histidine kinase n=1 Tax=Haloechinothrix sp. LS1_15 TaxID=2652248 RepID=UPI00294B69A3|nr:sensor histidine kinase [Haloechinothrix sp. LS1_15]
MDQRTGVTEPSAPEAVEREWLGASGTELDRTFLWLWEAFYGLVALATVATLFLDPAGRYTEAALATLLLAVLGCWYWFLGHRLAVAGESNSRRVALYLAVAAALLFMATLIHPKAAWAMALLIPQGFMLLTLAYAVPLTIVVVFIPAIVIITSGANLETALREAGPGVAVFGVLSVLIGYCMDRVIKQSDRQAELIDRLAASRTEVAELSREAGTAAERERLAREIHDTLAQGFTSMITLVQAAESRLADDPAAARRHLDSAARTGRENLDEARAMVAALTPAGLRNGSLADAVRREVDRLAEDTGIETCCEIDDSLPRLDTATEVVLLRAAQEALANVRRHSGASSATVALRDSGAGVMLSISDDGVGFPDGQLDEGYGLRGMRGRVAQVGGTISTRGEPGSGVTVEVEVPA